MESLKPERSSGAPHYDCVVISDLHLGSDVCQAKLLEEFLIWAVEHCDQLVINGDIFNDLNFKRLTKRHFACLKVIRRNTDRSDFHLVWVRGNHDGPIDIISHVVGVDILDEYVYDNHRIRLLIMHGDQFDTFITANPFLTGLACGLFYFIQKWMPHRAARYIRRITKKWQRNSELIEHRAVEYARTRGFRFVTCGHTHLPLVAEHGDVTYLNSGTWTDFPPCPYVVVQGDEVRLEYWPAAREGLTTGNELAGTSQIGSDESIELGAHSPRVQKSRNPGRICASPDFQEDLAMNDVDRHADVSLDSDRLEQLLEVPAPAQPVVMIEYRNRGVPWWLLVSLAVLLPLVAVIAYQQLVVQAYQERAANARYLAQKLESERTVEARPKADTAPVQPYAESAAPGAAPIVMSAQAVPAPAAAAAQPPASPVATSDAKPQPAPSAGVAEPALAGAGQPPEARVRTDFSIPLEPLEAAPAPKNASASTSGAAGGSPGGAQRDDSMKAQVGGPQQARAGEALGPGDAGSAGNRDRAALTSGDGASTAEPAGRLEPAPLTDPLPTQEEMNTQLAEESARKNAEEAEAALLLNDRLRVRRYEDRVQFHDDLRQILARGVKTAGTDIDDLCKRHRGDSDPRVRAKARVLWRDKRLPLAARVNQIRSMNISESDILDLMSDNLYARLHAPGGPRDNNEVRVRAAKLLLGCELSAANSAPEAASAPGTAPKRSRTTGTDSPR